jgi:hypothetical protein
MPAVKRSVVNGCVVLSPDWTRPSIDDEIAAELARPGTGWIMELALMFRGREAFPWEPIPPAHKKRFWEIWHEHKAEMRAEGVRVEHTEEEGWRVGRYPDLPELKLKGAGK